MALGLAVTLAAGSQAQAGIGNACEVKETPDGFVAIRARPSAKAPLVAKATPGHIVEVTVDKAGNPRAAGIWWHVRHFPGEAMPNPSDAAFGQVKSGWMHSKLIDGCG